MNSKEPVREWVGGRFKLPAKIEAMGERRAEMSMWVELPTLHVVGQELEDPQHPQLTFGQSLMRAMAAPLRGEPRRPQRVRVADAALAEELKSLSFLEVEVAATPEFDAVVRALGAAFGEGSYFADPLLGSDALEEFFRAACELWSARPWTMTDDEPLLQLEIPELGIDDGCVSIVGALGEARGFAFFPTLEDYERMIVGAHEVRPGGRLAPHCALYFSFEAADDVPVGMRKEISEHGWPLADDHAYPILQHVINGLPAPALEPQIRLAAAILRALAAFVLRHTQAFQAYGELEIRESLFDSGLELILSIPHPIERLEFESEAFPRAPTLSAENPYQLPFEPGALKRLLGALQSFSLHRVVGMFCAVCSVPQPPPPVTWLGEIVQHLPPFSEAHTRRTLDQLAVVYNHVVTTLQEHDIDRLIPEASDVAACREWARGYAMLLSRVAPSEMEIDVLDALFPIQALAELPEMLGLLDELRGDDSRETWLARYRESLGSDAHFLFQAWDCARAQPPAQTIKREAAKLGRNDPCTCGSGKKYKKCCALN